MFTALGETISERAGVLNIGLEGMMLLGAYAGFLGAYYGHSVWLGYLAGIAAGMVGVAVHGRALRLARPRPDRGRDRDHARRGRHHERPPGSRVREHLPAARLDPDLVDPAARPDPGAGRQPVRPAAARLPRLRDRRRDRLDLQLDERRAEPPSRRREAGGARSGRSERQGDPELGGARRPARSPASAARTSRSSPPGSSRRSSRRARATSRS